MDRFTGMTTFTTVVTTGSFASAAKRLNMSPPRVTNHIRALEERLGARLLNRSTRKLSLTEAGKAYFDQCTQILAQLEAAESSITDLQAAPRGVLRINVATVLTAAVVELTSEFAAAYPELTLELIATDRMPDLVEEGLDVAVRFTEPPASSLVVRTLTRFLMIMCAAPAYLAQRGVPKEPADLTRHNCISYMYPGFVALTQEWHLEGAGGNVTVPISGNLHTNSIDMLRQAAVDGRGIVVAPKPYVDEGLREGIVVRVLPDYHQGDLPVVAVYPNRQHLSAKVRYFIDFAVAHFAKKRKRSDLSAGETPAV